MTNLKKLTVQWDGKCYDIEIDDEYTIKFLKQLIFKESGLQPYFQHFLNLSSKDNILNEETKLHQLNISDDFLVIMTNRLDGVRQTAAPIAASETKNETGEGNLKTTHETKGKNLLVLDIDHTIFDCSREGKLSGTQAARPYLHHFLTTITQHYDIAIWSATKMSIIQKKLRRLGVIGNPDYQIKLCLDKTTMTYLPLTDDTVMQVKSLDTIWRHRKEYNSKSTIICDDQENNFVLNKRNGILVQPYSFTYYNSDKELLYLADYLKNIAGFYNFTLLNHSLWKRSVYIEK